MQEILVSVITMFYCSITLILMVIFSPLMYYNLPRYSKHLAAHQAIIQLFRAVYILNTAVRLMRIPSYLSINHSKVSPFAGFIDRRTIYQLLSIQR